MKIYVDGKVYDSEDTMIVMIFEDDKKRLATASHLNLMKPKDGKRLYAQFPETKYTLNQVDELFDSLSQ